MNRFYPKQTVNPAFKLCQPLPPLNLILKEKEGDVTRLAPKGFDQQSIVPPAHQPPDGNYISLCKGFASNNLF